MNTAPQPQLPQIPRFERPASAPVLCPQNHPVSVWRVALGVFLGNLCTGAAAGLVWLLFVYRP